MGKFYVQINSRLSNGNMGPGFNLDLEAANWTDALEKAKPAVQQALKDSGLIEIPLAAESGAASSPPIPG